MGSSLGVKTLGKFLTPMRGDMIEVFKLLNNLYDKDVDFKLRLKPAYSTRGNSYKLEIIHFTTMLGNFRFVQGL